MDDMRISCMVAVERAWLRMISVLFKPFSLSFWLILAVCAYLAALGTPSDNTFQFVSHFFTQGYMEQPLEEFGKAAQQSAAGDSEALETACRKIAENLSIAALFAWMGIAVIAGILFLWIRSVAEFVYLEKLVHRTSGFFQLVARYCRLGTSAFFWRIGYSIASGMLTMLLMMIPLAFSIGWIQSCINEHEIVRPSVIAVVGIVLSIVTGVFVGLILRCVIFYFNQFIVPVMYVRQETSFAATVTFWKIFRGHAWTFIKYLIVYIVLIIAAAILLGIIFGILLLVSFILSSGELNIVFSTPLLKVVIFLPLVVFFRLVSLELLNQFYSSKLL